MTYAFRIVNVFAESPLAGNPLACSRTARPRRRDDAGARAAVQPVGDDVRPAVDARDGARAHLHADVRDAVRRTSDARHCARRARHSARRRRRHARNAAPASFRCARSGDVWTLSANAPRHRAPAASRADLARDAGARRCRPRRRTQPLWVDTGSEQLSFRSPRSTPCAARAPKRAMLLHHAQQRRRARWPMSSRAKAIACLPRFFFPKHGAVIEDPGTGSACANLGGWLLATGAPLPQRTRRSTRARRSDGRCRLGLARRRRRSIRVSGRVIEIGRGTITL